MNKRTTHTQLIDLFHPSTMTVIQQAEVLRILAHMPEALPLCTQLQNNLRTVLTVTWLQTADLAEIFAVLDALHYSGTPDIDGRQLAAIAKRLLRHESTIGGPYSNQQGRLEIRTNAYIANCIRWLAAALPQVDRFLEQRIKTWTAASTARRRQRLTDLIVISRSLPHLAVQALEQLQVPMNASTTLSNFEQLSMYYIQSQHKAPDADKGSDYRAKQGQLAKQIEQDSIRHRFGDDQPVTVALALYALLYRPAAASTTQHQAGPRHDLERQQRIVQLASIVYDRQPEPLRSHAMRALNNLVRADRNYEICLLAHYFAESLSQDTSALRQETLDQLGAANIHTWLAYTIYDDFIDEEGTPELLPIANIALRDAEQTYRQVLPDHAGFQAFIHNAFDRMDAANSRETVDFRFHVHGQHITVGKHPDYQERQLLADRALLHIAGPIGVLAALGYSAADTVWQQTVLALRHFLIGRQLADDMHDWVNDMRAGHISPVVADIIRALALTPGVYSLQELLPAARRHFWQRLAPALVRTTDGHLQLARNGLTPYLSKRNRFFRFLDDLEAAGKETLIARQQGQDFLQQL